MREHYYGSPYALVYEDKLVLLTLMVFFYSLYAIDIERTDFVY